MGGAPIANMLLLITLRRLPMSQSGQQHPKADQGGQRTGDPKTRGKDDAVQKGSGQEAIEAGKKANRGDAKDAKKSTA